MIFVQEKENGANFHKKKSTSYLPQSKQEIKAPVFIPFEILKATRRGYEQNIFIQNLLHNVPFPFDVKEIEQVISLYQLGTVCKGYRNGAITFPSLILMEMLGLYRQSNFIKQTTLKARTFYILSMKKIVRKIISHYRIG